MYTENNSYLNGYENKVFELSGITNDYISKCARHGYY